MASLAQAVANLRRTSFQPRIAQVTAINGDGSVDVSYAGSDPANPPIAWLTDSTKTTVTVGCTAVLHPFNDSLLVADTMGATVGTNLLPNGDFSLPADGLQPYGWVASPPDSNEVWTLLNSVSDAPPGAPSAGVLMISSMVDTSSVSVTSALFTIDPATAYKLSFQIQVDASISTPQVWPSLNCYSNPNNWPTNVSNGPLSPNPSTVWQSYSTTITTTSDATQVAVNLGFLASSSSSGAVRFATVSLNQA